MSIDDSLRRLANQAFFDKLIIMPDDTVDGQHGEPFNILFNPDVQRAALARQQPRRNLDLKPGTSSV